jgi:histidinol-phosphate aminotransferase
VIRAERDLLLAKLADLPGVQVFPSQANMLLLRLAGPPGRAAAVFEALKARRVLVKNVSTMHPLLVNCLRLTVGSPDQNAQLLAALRAALTQGTP